MIEHYERNTVGRDFVVGDLHGCFKLLEKELDKRHFCTATDRLFSVGDLVDRGLESHRALEWLTKPWFHAVRGNHEQMAIGVTNGKHDTDNYIANGGQWFLDLAPAKQAMYAKAFDLLPVAIEVETDAGIVGIVHAECPTQDWREFAKALLTPFSSNNAKNHLLEKCLWSRKRHNEFDCSDILNVDSVIVGHTPVDPDQWLGNVHYIDTGAVFGRRLTIIRIN